MLGLIQKVLLDLVEEAAGQDARTEVLRRAGLPPEQRYRLDAVYPDDEWQRLLESACDVLGRPQAEVEELYADFFGRDALRRWPAWFRMSSTARQFLERQPVIHNAFATGVRDPEARMGIADKFRVETREDGIVTRYRSPNQLCGLYKALARWVLDHYREAATITEVTCTKQGDAECEIHVRWNPPART